MRVVITSEVPASWDHLRQVVLSAGVECSAGDCVRYDDLAVRLTRSPVDLVLLVLGPGGSAALPVVALAASTHTPVLVVGPASASPLIVQTIRAGARGFLDEAHLREELLAALEKLRADGDALYRRGRLFAVLAASPGSGVTSLAFALAKQAPGQVALAELGAGVPSLALNLNLQPQHTVADLVRRWEQMDAAMVRQTLVEHPAGVSVLAYKPETLRAEPLAPLAMRQTLVLLSRLFAAGVLDLGDSDDPARLEALRLAGTVMLVVRLDVPALRLSRQLLRQFADQGVPREKVRVVANRYGQRKQVPAKEASRVLGLPIQGWIPDDPGTLNQAHNAGLPLVNAARRAAITRTFDSLARDLHRAAA
jgi:pilus assembly protein CpaE